MQSYVSFALTDTCGDTLLASIERRKLNKLHIKRR